IHDGPGIRTTVFFKGCPLACWWCHNPEGIDYENDLFFYQSKCIGCGSCIEECPQNALKYGDEVVTIDRERCDSCGRCTEVCPTGALKTAGNEVTIEEVMDEIENSTIYHDTSGGGVTLSGGEPFLQFEFIEKLIDRCKERGVHVTVDTCGDVEREKFESLMDKIDLFLFDLKVIDEELHRKYTGTSNENILNNLERLLRSGAADVILRFPLIPCITDTEENVRSILKFLAPFSGVKEVHLLPYHDVEEKYNKLGVKYNMDRNKKPAREKIEMIKKMFEEEGYKVKEGG
ncbi:MAG: glycyl-radical enzyme activating protein, partial [Thermoplasmata archaeon]